MNATLRTGLGLLLLLPALASAATVYTWTDDRGVTHFSETPPPDRMADTRRLEIDAPPAMGPAFDDDYFSVINQARRMQQSRLENERARVERLKAEAQAKRAAAQARAARRSDDEYYYREPWYTPIYSYPRHPWYRPGFRPGFRPGVPGHLPSRPGPGPGPGPGQRPVRRSVGVNTR